jgi:hypothetical protein
MGMAGAALKDAQQDGLISSDLWLEGGNGCSVWPEINPV